MPRLIDADKANRRIEPFICGGCDDYHNCGNCLANKALSLLRGEQTVDAVEVVRCKDCRYHNSHRCYMAFDLVATDNTDYCSRGERREDAETN